MTEPVTSREHNFALLDVEHNTIRTTVWGSLAIFSTRGVAERVQAQLGGPGVVTVIPVFITPTSEVRVTS